MEYGDDEENRQGILGTLNRVSPPIEVVELSSEGKPKIHEASKDFLTSNVEGIGKEEE